MRCCRVELCSSSGQALKGFHLDECHGAPHEFRGVDRHALLDALRAKLPKGMVQYGMPVTRAQLGDDGEPCRRHLLAVACRQVQEWPSDHGGSS